jgi:transposase InsO family protein
LIAEYRRSNPDHGFKRIQDYLKSKHLVVVTRKQIREVLKEHGLLEALDSSFDREEEPAKGSRRFEARYPGQLYQMDVTYVYVTGIPVLYLVVIIDDFSRFCVGADLCTDQRGTTLIEVLHNACVNHGKPVKLLTDQGRGFYTWSMERTAFEKYLDEIKIEHIVSDPHSPQTAGKVERLIQTIKKELLQKVHFNSFDEARRGIEDYLKSYNFERPHQGIGGARPSDRFYGVIGETSRIESALSGKSLDLSKGYLVYKVHDHTLSVVCSQEGLQVFLDGKLLKEEDGHGGSA